MPSKSFFKKNTVLMLKSFIYTAERKSLTEAGKILLLPVSSISRYITDLEKDMNKKLINTLKGKIFLTPEGEKLYRRANKLIKSWDSILSDVEIEKKVIRVASYASAMSSVMPEFVKKMQFLMPDVLIDIQMLSKDEFNKAMRLDEIDLGIYAYYKDTMTDKEPDFMYREVGKYEPNIMIHKENPANKDFEGREELSVEELFLHPETKDITFTSKLFMLPDLLPRKIVKLNNQQGEILFNIGSAVLNKGCLILEKSLVSHVLDQFQLYKTKETDYIETFACFKENSEIIFKAIQVIKLIFSKEV